MSYINFESSRVKEAERKQKKQARDAVLKKAEAEYNRRKEEDERARVQGNDKWILPSLEARIKAERKKEKKKKHKTEKKAKRKIHSSSGSGDESEEEVEWVEKVAVPNEPFVEKTFEKATAGESHSRLNEDKFGLKTDVSQEKQEKSKVSLERDEWMTLPGLFPCTSREQLRQQSGCLSKAEEQRQKDRYMIDTLRQSDRELNPYWKDGGTGLPQGREDKDQGHKESQILPAKSVGDQGVGWLRRALKRTEEQAAEEGRSVEDVAAERWGSLQKLKTMLAEAEERSRIHGGHERSGNEFERNELEDRKRKDKYDRDRTRRAVGGQNTKSSREHDKSHTNSKSFQKPRTDDISDRKHDNKDSHSLGRRTSHTFQKPKEEFDVSGRQGTSCQDFSRLEVGGVSAPSTCKSPVASGNWRKKVADNVKSPVNPSSSKESKPMKKESPSSSSESEDEKEKTAEIPHILTDKEMNGLGARLVKAEVLGNESLHILKTMLAEAEERSTVHGRHECSGNEFERNELEDRKRKDKYDRDRTRRAVGGQNTKSSHEHDKSHTNSKSFQKPRTDDISDRKHDNKDSHSLGRRTSHAFQKPKEEFDVSGRQGTSCQDFSRLEVGGVSAPSTCKSPVASGNWRKKVADNVKSPVNPSSSKESKPMKKESPSSSSESEDEKEKTAEIPHILTDKEMNDLGARLVKAEILGNESLQKLKTMLAEVEERSTIHGRHERSGNEFERNELEDRKRKDKYDRDRTRRAVGGQNTKSSHEHDKSHTNSKSFQKPRTDDISDRKHDNKDSHSLGRRTSHTFQKPKEEFDVSGRQGTSCQDFSRLEVGGVSAPSTCKSPVASGNWRKKVADNVKSPVNPSSSKESKPMKKESPSSSSESEDEKEKTAEIPHILTDKEMNDLGARLVKAEILGNETLAKELKKKLDAARTARAMKVTETGKTAATGEVETVILTRTDSRGFVRPLQRAGQHVEPAGGRRRKQKMETHADGKRVRYYADDDKYSLKDLFEREKLVTAEDENKMFSKLAAKGVGRTDSEYDMDDIFAEQAQMKESDGKVQSRERGQAIREHKMIDKVLENCSWCFDSKGMMKHLVVAVGSKVYLCLPPYQSLTEGHCLIVPMYHTPCATQLDEDVWSEMQTFRKTLTSMFLEKLDLDVVFFESAMSLQKFPHMILECVPMPRETGDLAPIYFKKAILECEIEWATNKKLVDLSGKDVRRAIPKGLPYFAVDFGLESGFAHVIEDEKMFPKNFAQEIIGGMLDLDHSLWRKQRRENFDLQRKKVLQFAEWWKTYDFTVRKEKDSSDSD